jgi:hypothetical protein
VRKVKALREALHGESARVIIDEGAAKESLEYPSFSELKGPSEADDMPLVVLGEDGPRTLIGSSPLLSALTSLDINVVRVYSERSDQSRIRGICAKAMAKPA